MNRFFLLILHFILTFNILFSQNIEGNVLANSGNYFVDEKSISFTLGEPLVDTYMQSEFSVFQGFQNIAISFTDNLFIQSIDLPQGWSYWSSYLLPKHPAIEDIFSDLNENIVILKDQHGDVFWPYFGINGIQDYVFGYGYQIKMANQETLEIQGYKISNPAIQLFENWNILGFLYEEPIPVEDVIAPIVDNVIIIKDEIANVYWPFLGINTIDYMLPGEAYAIKLYSDLEFEFPFIQTQSRLNNFEQLRPNYYTGIINTGDNMTLGFPFDVLKKHLNYGDEVGVFDSNNKLVGSSIFKNSNMAITVWGNDNYSIKKDGMYEGEKLAFKVWNHKLNHEQSFTIKKWYEGLGIYNSNGISIAEELLIENNKEPILSVFPNPTIDLLNLKLDLPNDSPVSFSLYSTIGKKEVLFSEELNKGLHNFDFFLQKSPGLYYLIMHTENYNTIYPITIINQ